MPDIAIELGSQMELARVSDQVVSNKARPHGRIRVEALGEVELRGWSSQFGLHLKFASRKVVSNGPSGNIIKRICL